MNESTIVKFARIELQLDALMDYGTAMREALVEALKHAPKPHPAELHHLLLTAQAKLDVVGGLIGPAPTGGDPRT